VVLGDSGVGKTSFVTRLSSNTYDSTEAVSTQGVNFVKLDLPNFCETQQVQLWDTAGQAHFHSLIFRYCKDADLILHMYDISSRQSFVNITQYWAKNAAKYAGKKASFGLVGNKADKRLAGADDCDCVSKKEAAAMASRLFGTRIGSYECSAKLGTGVVDTVSTICSRVMTYQKERDQVELENQLNRLQKERQKERQARHQFEFSSLEAPLVHAHVHAPLPSAPRASKFQVAELGNDPDAVPVALPVVAGWQPPVVEEERERPCRSRRGPKCKLPSFRRLSVSVSPWRKRCTVHQHLGMGKRRSIEATTV